MIRNSTDGPCAIGCGFGVCEVWYGGTGADDTGRCP
jgi:hypothetical protein